MRFSFLASFQTDAESCPKDADSCSSILRNIAGLGSPCLVASLQCTGNTVPYTVLKLRTGLCCHFDLLQSHRDCTDEPNICSEDHAATWAYFDQLVCIVHQAARPQNGALRCPAPPSDCCAFFPFPSFPRCCILPSTAPPEAGTDDAFFPPVFLTFSLQNHFFPTSVSFSPFSK